MALQIVSTQNKTPSVFMLIRVVGGRVSLFKTTQFDRRLYWFAFTVQMFRTCESVLLLRTEYLTINITMKIENIFESLPNNRTVIVYPDEVVVDDDGQIKLSETI